MKTDWVYFCLIDQVLKIGHSLALNNRIRSFASYGHDVKLLAIEAGGRPLEKRLHRMFRDYHLTGAGLSRELFSPAQPIMLYIRDHRTCAAPRCSQSASPLRVVCPDHELLTFPEERLVDGGQLSIQVTASRETSGGA